MSDVDTASIFDGLVSELEGLHKAGQLKAITYIAVGTDLLSELYWRQKVINDAQYTASMNGYPIAGVQIQVTGNLFFFTFQLDESCGGFQIHRITQSQLLQPVTLDHNKD